MLTDTNKNSTENHAHGYSQFRLKVWTVRSIVDLSRLYFYSTAPEKCTPAHDFFLPTNLFKVSTASCCVLLQGFTRNPIISSSSNSIMLPTKLLLCECLSDVTWKTSFNVTLSKYTHANSQEFHLIFPVSSSHSTWSRFGLNPAAGRLCSAPAHQPARLTEFYSAAQKGIGIWNLTQCINRGTAMTTHTFINVNVIQDIQ